jgi:hypothetical protein
MPMEIFVIGRDLATAGGLVVVVTPVRSPPGSSSFFLSARPWGLESFTLAVSLRSGRVEFLRGCELNRMHEENARYLGTFSAGA